MVGEEVRAQVDEAFIAEARAMGVDPASLVSAPEADDADDAFVLLPENVEAFDFFLGLSTQWKWATPAMGTPMRVGLDYACAEAAMRIQGLRGERRVRMFADIRAMERAVLNVERESTGV